MTKIRRAESSAILDSLQAGVTPAVGLQHILVGRQLELKSFLDNFDVVKKGGSGCRILTGIYGSGKTFLLTFLSYMVVQRKFVVARVEFSPHKTLYGGERGLTTYRELTERMATRTEPQGGALPRILERWFTKISREVANRLQLPEVDYENEEFLVHMRQKMRDDILTHLEDFAGGFDFSEVLTIYFQGLINADESLQRAAIRWLRGEYRTKTEARQALGAVRSIITEDNWIEYVKLWAKFVSLVGYGGFIVLFDECVNLYNISHRATREKNYDMILQLFNEANQGRFHHLYIIFSGTPEFVIDERRGLYSYPALKTRLVPNPYETDRFRDMTQPVIELQPLRAEELIILLQKVRNIHAEHHKINLDVSDEEIRQFVVDFLSRPGAEKYGTARDCIRGFLSALNILWQNPEMSKNHIFKQMSTGDASSTDHNVDSVDDLAGFHEA